MRLRPSEATIAKRLKAAWKAGDLVRFNETGMSLGPGKEPICAAVLVPLVVRDGQWHLLLTRRTDAVESHKGQVSFPGGGCDESETEPEQTALRETWEEIGIKTTEIRILGRLNDLVTITHFRVTPVVGVVPWPYPFVLSPQEVSRVFSMPLAWIADRDHWQEKNYTLNGEPRPYPVITYQEYDGEVLWGATARITHNFLHVIGLLKEQ